MLRYNKRAQSAEVSAAEAALARARVPLGEADTMGGRYTARASVVHATPITVHRTVADDPGHYLCAKARNRK